MPGTADSGGRPIRFRITGMHCAGCAATVQRAVEAEPGVVSAAVSVVDGSALIRGDGLAPDRLARAIEATGFGAEIIETPPPPADLRSAIEDRQSEHARLWRQRAVVATGIWVPLAAVHWFATGPWHVWVLAAGATLVMATAGAGFIRSALVAARHRTTNMDTLIAIGSTTAYVASLVTLIGQQAGRFLEEPLYFTEAAALLALISVGHWMEARSSARAGSAVRDLLELQPDDAEIVDDAGEPVRIVPSADLSPGDRVLIRPGARIPVDGVVVRGASDVDESIVTGEPVPVPRGIGDEVIAGAINTSGRLIVEARVDGHSTTVARIAALVSDAQTSKARIQRLADRVCAIFVPAVLTIAALTLGGWWIAGEPGRGLVAMVSVLIISCPCALGLATPMAVMVGTGSASRAGILIKSAASIERAGAATHVVFDKTGTLTKGTPTVTAVVPEADATSEEVLRYAAAVEGPSEHPIAQAIVAEAGARGLELTPVSGFLAQPGIGVTGRVDGRLVEVGRMDRAGCRVTVDGVVIGSITVDDTVRPDAAEAIATLKAMGIGITMLSGDRQAAAEAIGTQIGLDATAVIGDTSPDEKATTVGRMSGEQRGGLVMVGDGLNDAAALARADLGIAMASGTTIAIESADIVIPGRSVMAVPRTIRLSRLTLTTIRQNLFFAFIYNVCAIPAAAFGLLGAHGPIIAAAAMAASDLTVIGNALRLRARLRRP
ncbi:MAG: heavy metal translocating P-type ATPase [Planctomycetota bacterium]